jgi:hypothetical protein
MNKVTLTLTSSDKSRVFFGSRHSALEFRQDLDNLLMSNQHVILDFTGITCTQGFVDELVGVLVFHQGPSIIERLSFSGCNEDVKAIISFVLNDRAAQYQVGRNKKITESF